MRDAAGLQVDLAKELSSLLAPSGMPTDTLLAVAVGSVSYVIRVIEMAVAGQIDVDDAIDACMTCLLGIMTRVGMATT